MGGNDTEARVKKIIFLKYRGIETERLAEKLIYIGRMIKPVFTLRKKKAITPTLKPRTDLCNQSNVIYQYECALCSGAYVGYTTSHLGVRVEEHHTRKTSLIWKHHQECEGAFDRAAFTCLYKSNKGRFFETMVETCIHYKKPKLDEKDEPRRRQLRLKLIQVEWKTRISKTWFMN